MVKFYTVFILLIAAALGVLVFVSGGYYPVALVEGKIITARTFLKNYEAAVVSYDNAKATYRFLADAQHVVEPLSIQAAVLQELIENTLVHGEAERKLGEDLPAIVASKLQEVESEETLGEAVEALVGMNAEEFRDEVLIPIAEREIVMGRLFLEGESFVEWLEEKKKSSGVRIFSSKLYWTGETVEVRK